MSDAGSVTDWISAVCSAIAAAIALVTVITVYVAARQLLTEHRAYQMGLSEETLGSWHKKVKTKELLGMQQQISTPVITLPALVKKNWEPNVGCPIDAGSKAGASLCDQEKATAKASWVNFVEALGLGPEDDGFYHMSTQTNLVNGIIPMRWAGKDLVGICTMLGYQSYEGKPSFKTPMPLPMQWSGPMGWLQFRPSPDGCVAEFRRRGKIDNQLSSELHDFYKEVPRKHEPHCLRSRLWRSINSMSLRNGKALYLGGADQDDLGRGVKNTFEQLGDKVGELGGLLRRMKERAMETRDAHADSALGDDGLFDELMEGAFSDEEIARKLGVGETEKTKPSATQGVDKDDLTEIPEFLRNTVEKGKAGMKEVLMPCCGLLSTVVEGELAHSRGLNITDSVEYHRKFMTLEDMDKKRFKYHLGNLYMDDDLLPVFKEALELLRPDGYFFTPTGMLALDINDVYSHVKEVTDKTKKVRIFPHLEINAWPASNPHKRPLHFAMMLCNEFQHIRMHKRATFTVADMVAVAKASRSLREVHQAPDLTWALLVCPELFAHLAQAFESVQNLGAFDHSRKPVSCRGGNLDCTNLMEDCEGRLVAPKPTAPETSSDSSSPSIHPEKEKTSTTERKYNIPLCGDGDFSGSQLLAAFLEVMVTYYWIEKLWISDVGLYDTVIPPTITMC